MATWPQATAPLLDSTAVVSRKIDRVGKIAVAMCHTGSASRAILPTLRSINGGILRMIIIQNIRKIACGTCLLIGIATPALGAEVSPDLIAKARQEGQVIYYTDLIVDQIVRPLIAAFEAKYGIKVNFTRGDSQVNAVKLINEYKAGRVTADVFGMTSAMETVIAAGAARQFSTVNGDELPPQYRDGDRYWVSSHLFVMEPGINTSLVPPGERPKTYEDLLAPYWKDKLVWKPNDLSGAPGFIANRLINMGEER